MGCIYLILQVLFNSFYGITVGLVILIYILFFASLLTMSIAAGVILSITLQQVDAAPDTQGTAQTDHDGLQSIDCAVEKFHKVLTFCRLFCGTQK